MKMVCCAVPLCKNTSAKMSKIKNGITFHRFPRDPNRKYSWEKAINRVKWWATASSTVCSEHFDANNFYITASGLRKLSIDAVPSINICPNQHPTSTISNGLPIDVDPTDTEEVVKLKLKVKRLEIIAANRKKRLNLMWQGRRRLKKKLEKLKYIIKHLIKFKQEKENT